MQHTLKTLLGAAALLGLSAVAYGQSFNSASEQADSDLKAALAELTETRDEIAEEKIPLIREVYTLEDDVRQKSDELNRLRRLRDNSDLGLNRLREQVKAIDAQNDYAAGLLDEFVRSFETRIDYSEVQLYAAAAEEARLALDDPNLTQAERFNKQIEVIGVALNRLEKLTGGYTFEGKALAPTGDIEEGSYAAFGPTVYFASSQSELAGVTFTKLNVAEAAIAVPGEAYSAGIREFIKSGEGSIPIDPTLGKALKIESSKESIAEHIAHGGAVGYITIGLGVACALIGLFKLFEILSFKTPSSIEVQTVLKHVGDGDMPNALTAASAISCTGGDILRKGVENAEDTRGNLEELLYEKILTARPKLERFLAFMALTAAAAPLLGLLGTVIGMINTFKLITVFGTGDASNLASGISQALVTTKLGLIVAIPALIFHGLLSRMARQKIGDLEQIAVGFINGVVGARNKNED
ncbi:MotA/TolQ/ExbB proton channel family protein [bacterium]|nr:MotA/TolQ/ExbB proton channel family protein [bacterium]